MEPVIVQYHEQLKGILTPELFLAQKTLDPDYRNQIEDLIHQGEKPRLLLLKLVAVEQDIKQFLPPVWYKTAHV
ncbi:hypothetical protein HY492_01270, partial [Candidatus Woesearchaeota archaeon]|nr:hypothetical protein [Candidatus Woesearchaeota archaeon]